MSPWTYFFIVVKESFYFQGKNYQDKQYGLRIIFYLLGYIYINKKIEGTVVKKYLMKEQQMVAKKGVFL